MVNGVLTYKGRLPGVLCEPALSRPAMDPLRLDVTAFIGFAERGPLDVPMMVEDISQYEMIFGDDLVVARDGGKAVYAQLPEAVRAFFNNGGRRAYVARVAGEEASPNHFQIPGIVSRDSSGALRRVTAPAAWVGRWSDVMRIGTQIRSEPLLLREETFGMTTSMTSDFIVEMLDVGQIQPGDIVCLHFDDATASRLIVRIDTVSPTVDLPVTLSALPVALAGESLAAFGSQFVISEVLPDALERLDSDGWTTLTAPMTALVAANGGYIFTISGDETVVAGDILRLSYGDGSVYIAPVTRVDASYDDDTEIKSWDVFVRQAWLEIDPSTITGLPQQADRLSFDLTILEGERTLEVWEDLSFGSWVERLALPDEAIESIHDLTGRSLRLGQPNTASDSGMALTFLPLGMDELPLFNTRLRAEDLTGDDGLETFDPVALFLDSNFAGEGKRTIIDRANELLYLSSTPQRLRKLHSVIPIDEIAIVSIPDLVQRPWGPPQPIIEEPPPPPPEVIEEKWRFLNENCPVPPPEVEEESLAEEPIELSDLLDSSLFDDDASGLAAKPVLDPPSFYTPDVLENLMDVQQVMIEVCAARTDMVTILSLPQHFKQREVVDWHKQFTHRNVFFDGNPLSYAAVYHGWIQTHILPSGDAETVTVTAENLRSVAPDGTICGMIADREWRRGVWVAPANEPLIGVIGLTPNFDDEVWETLYNRQINVLRQQPGRFALMSVHTLSKDRLFLQLSIRRLLIYLRKWLLRVGEQFVFEPNNARFVRRIHITLERQLTTLMNLGALAAFEVVTNDEVNTPQDRDQGRFIAEIKIAPTHGIEFISLTLLRSGENILDIIER